MFYMVGTAARLTGRAQWPAIIVGGAASIAAVVAADPARIGSNLPVLTAFLAAGVVSSQYTRVIAGAEYDHREAALSDPLTGLLNRSGLEARVAELGERSVHNDGSVATVICDLDHFKRVNDVHGHDAGDTVLRDVAHTLRAHTRSFELISRLGGEEFLLVLPGADVAEGQRIAEQLRCAVAAAEPGGVRVTASFGVSAAKGAEIAFHDLHERADEALYTAKATGRDRVAPLQGRSWRTRPDPHPSIRSRRRGVPGLWRTGLSEKG